MLDSMRALSKSFASKILMGLLIIAFGAWGIGDMARDRTPTYAAKIGKSTISMAEYTRQRALMAQQLEQLGVNFPASKLEFAVMRQLIQEHLFLNAMNDLGLFVNEGTLIDSIRTMPQFKDASDMFDAKLFQSYLKNQGLPERILLAQLKQEVTGKFMLDSIDVGDAPLPTSVLTLRAIHEGEMRDAVLITIPAKDAIDETNIDALTQYYEENKSVLYMQPELRSLKYVVISDADVDAVIDASISGEDIQNLIKTDSSLNTGLARMKLRAERRDTALHELSNTVEDALAAGRTMAEAFAAAGIKSPMQELANVSATQASSEKDDVKKTAIEQGFTLAQGELSRLVSTARGARLMVTVTAITPSSPKPFEQVKSQVKESLGKKLAQDAAKAKALSIKEALAKTPDWKAVASEQKLATRVVSKVVRPSVLEKADDTIPPALRQALFERNVGEVAGPMTIANGDQMLAVITQSHLPTPDSNRLRQSRASADAGQEISNAIQNNAYEYLVSRYPVKVNEAAMGQTANTTQP